jgi:biotin operon repressor
MTGVGRDPAVTREEIYELIRSDDRRAWSAKDIADHFGVSSQTTKKRLSELRDAGWLDTVEVSNVTAYYVPEDPDLDLVEQHKQDLVREFSDRFVGLQTDPTEVTPDGRSNDAGDKVQLEIVGEPGRWSIFHRRRWKDRREQLDPMEIDDSETQALVSGVLYEKATVPIEHINYPDDYDLELNIGGQYEDVEGRERPILIAAGVKNYLIKPCDDALFLGDISVDWISPPNEDGGTDEPAIDSSELEEMFEDVSEWREENIDADPDEEWEI